MKTKIGYGQKENIDSAITEQKIDSGDIVFTSDTDELAFITPENKAKFIKSRSSKEYTLNGTSLGALQNGDIIPIGIDMDGLLNLITQKAVVPTYYQPSVSIAKNGNGTAPGNYEAGTSIIPNFNATFTKNDAGDLTKLTVMKGAEELGSGTSSPYNYTGETFVLGDETISYKAVATYKEGPVKNNNLNQPDPTGQVKAGSKNSNNVNYTGQRNLFYGTGVGELPEVNSAMVRGLSNKKLNPTKGYVFNVNVEVGQQYVVIAYPASLNDVKEIMYVETNDPGCASNFTKNTVNVADARGGENGLKSYNVYTYFMKVPAAAKMTFKVTI